MKAVIFLFALLVLTSFSMATDTNYPPEGFGYNDRVGPILVPATNYSELPTVNASEFWLTNLGALDDANSAQFDNIGGTLTIDESHFDLLYCQLTGCTISGNITATWFNGNFNWIVGDDWNSFNGSTLLFNESKLTTQFFNVSTLEVVTGTGAGTLEDIQTYNNIPYNVTEDASDLELRINFTGIEDFNELIVRYKSTEEDLAHTLIVEIYDVSSSTWEEYGTLPGTSHYHIVEFGIFDSDNHIDGDGVVQIRFFQDEGVPPRTHLHNFDWVSLSKGFGTPSGEEVDPDSIHKDGDVPWMGNENGNQYNTTNWNWGFFNYTKTEDRYLLGNNASIGYNGTCAFVFYNQTGSIISTLGCT